MILLVHSNHNVETHQYPAGFLIIVYVTRRLPPSVMWHCSHGGKSALRFSPASHAARSGRNAPNNHKAETFALHWKQPYQGPCARGCCWAQSRYDPLKSRRSGGCFAQISNLRHGRARGLTAARARAARLEAAGVRILGTSVDAIDRAEHRGRFEEVCRIVEARVPTNGMATSEEQALAVPEAYRTSYTASQCRQRERARP